MKQYSNITVLLGSTHFIYKIITVIAWIIKINPIDVKLIQIIKLIQFRGQEWGLETLPGLNHLTIQYSFYKVQGTDSLWVGDYGEVCNQE